MATETATFAEKVIAVLRSPAAAGLQQSAAQEVDEAARQKDIDAYNANLAASRRDTPVLERARDLAEEERRVGQLAQDKLNAKAAAALAAVSERSTSDAAIRSNIRSRLYKAIAEEAQGYWSEFHSRWEAAARALSFSDTQEYDALTGRRKTRFYSNKASVDARRDACIAAMAFCGPDGGICLIASRADRQAKFRELLDALPAITAPVLVSTVAGGVLTKVSDAPPSVYDRRGLERVVMPQHKIGGPES